MIYRSMTLKGCTIPNFKLNGTLLHVVASYKYIGHYITDYLSDDDDIVEAITTDSWCDTAGAYCVWRH